jgi:FlaA1/EpsC-like NDP-sugar epimerase
LFNGKVTVQEIRNVEVEDLLARDPVQVDLESIAGYVGDKTVLVTGAGGSIGAELCRQLATFPVHRMLLLGQGENSIYMIEKELRQRFPERTFIPIIADVKDRARIDSLFQQYRPEVIFHAAAHKHVPLMEMNPLEAIKNNIFGTRHVAECAHLYEAERFVLISTDKAVNPTSVMGATKRVAEWVIQTINETSSTKFSAVRFGNVLGSRGSVIPYFKEQIAAGGPVTVTHPNMVRYFMTIPEAVQLVIQAGGLAHGGEVFILDMGEPVKIVDLARDLIRLSGFEPGVDIEIEFTGIRPGEKLFEELLTQEEGVFSTRHERIFIGKPEGMSAKELSFELKKLERLVANEQTETIRELLQRLVPHYQQPLKEKSELLSV